MPAYDSQLSPRRFKGKLLNRPSISTAQVFSPDAARKAAGPDATSPGTAKIELTRTKNKSKNHILLFVTASFNLQDRQTLRTHLIYCSTDFTLIG